MCWNSSLRYTTTYVLLSFCSSAFAADIDFDGLDAAAEAAANTKVKDPDTDGDGLWDGWEVEKHVLGEPLPNANPLKKDLYVEIDFAKRSLGSNDSETKSMQQQLEAKLVAAFSQKGIALHIDWDDALPQLASNFPQSGWKQVRESNFDQRIKALCFRHLLIVNRLIKSNSSYVDGMSDGLQSCIISRKKKDGSQFTSNELAVLIERELVRTAKKAGGSIGSIFKFNLIARNIRGAHKYGWTTPIWDDGTKLPTLPEHLRVVFIATRNNRDYFTVYEGRNRGRQASITQVNGKSYLRPGHTVQSQGVIKFNYRTKQLWYGSNGPVQAFTQLSNKVPLGVHDLEIPYELHDLARSYVDKSNYAQTWFRIGHSGDRYLHPGTRSLGCATVGKEHPNPEKEGIAVWDEIYHYLINARKDKRSVGTIEVVD